ncbi:hypothetical protein AVL63_12765 [Nesterenkonia jeotgali]|uniref:Uncharacterized protein n=1 Tax=Nesterenkonia jeotgali TaxID=317018 RepID=A0A0W8IC51_9MICC|nr:hypothetical protein AVL63_12765 [Nesterenkonia jeotgali]
MTSWDKTVCFFEHQKYGVLRPGLAAHGEVKEDTTEQGCYVLQHVTGDEAEIEDSDGRTRCMILNLLSVPRGGRPIGRVTLLGWVSSHDRSQICSEGIIVVFDAGYEVVPAVRQQATQSHLEGRNVSCDFVIVCLLHLDTIWHEKVTELLQVVIDWGIKISTCGAATESKFAQCSSDVSPEFTNEAADITAMFRRERRPPGVVYYAGILDGFLHKGSHRFPMPLDW